MDKIGVSELIYKKSSLVYKFNNLNFKIYSYVQIAFKIIATVLQIYVRRFNR